MSTAPALSTSFQHGQLVPLPEGSPSQEYQYLDTRKHLRRSEGDRVESRLRSKRVLLALLRPIADEQLKRKQSGRKYDRYLLERASAVEHCGRTIQIKNCGRHLNKETLQSCGFRGCVHCARRQSRQKFRKHYPKFVVYAHQHPTRSFFHLVLTQKQVKGETMDQSRGRLVKALTKLRSRGIWKHYFTGGGYSIEPLWKHRQGAYHTHAHILVAVKGTSEYPLSQAELKELKKAWGGCSGGAKNLHLRKVDDLERGLREVLKYVTKPIDYKHFTPKQMKEFLHMKGKRLFNLFGDLYSFDLGQVERDELERRLGITEAKEKRQAWSDAREGDPCPECGDPIFVDYVSEDDLADFLRRHEASKLQGRGRSP